MGVAMAMAVESERGSDERANSTQQGIDPVRTFNSHASPFRTGCHKALFAHASLAAQCSRGGAHTAVETTLCFISPKALAFRRREARQNKRERSIRSALLQADWLVNCGTCSGQY